MTLIFSALLLLAAFVVVLAVLADAALRGHNAYRENVQELGQLERGQPGPRRPRAVVRFATVPVSRPRPLCVAA